MLISQQVFRLISQFTILVLRLSDCMMSGIRMRIEKMSYTQILNIAPLKD